MTSPTLRENRDFIAVLLGHGVSALGDAVSFTAIPLLVLLLTGSGLAILVAGLLLDHIGGTATLALIGIAVLAVAGSFALAAPLRRANAHATAI
jgi:hypothetical protein